MQITLQLFAMLRDKLPPEARRGEMPLELPEGATVRMVIEKMEIPEQLAHLVMINGFHLSREDIDNRPLVEGEVLSIFPPVAGG